MSGNLKDVTPEKLHGAIVKMLEELDIAGSTYNYNLYDCIQKEYNSAVNYVDPITAKK